MQADDAQRLRDAWGGKPCEHPDFQREYYLGAQGDYLCTQCGEVLMQEQVEQIRRRKQSEDF